jgi:hypothetical protein
MNFAARNGLLLNRLDRHAAHPATAELRKAAENCFTVAQNFANYCDELAQDRFLTADGKRAKLAEARTKYEREMETARAPIDSAAKGVERLRGQIKLAPIDRTDAVAEMRRAELRTYMRSLSEPARMGALLAPQPDPQILDAVLDAPAALSGVSAEHYALAKTAREKQLHGAKLDAVEALQEIIGEANAAAAVARNDLR